MPGPTAFRKKVRNLKTENAIMQNCNIYLKFLIKKPVTIPKDGKVCCTQEPVVFAIWGAAVMPLELV